MEITPVNDIDDGLGSIHIPTSNKVALIDADTLVYTTCLELEEREDLLPRDYYSSKEWEEIINAPTYDKENHCLWFIDPDYLIQRCSERIDEVIYKVGTHKAEIYLSSGRTFRHKLTDMYKRNRKNLRYPTGLESAKTEILNHYDGMICDGFEADDIVVYLKRTDPKKYILCAIDKDVLNSVPGEHFDYYHQRMTWKKTDVTTAIRWPYIQCLTGDTSDNIPGIRGVGPKRAEKILEDTCLPGDMWGRVVKAYEKAGLTIKDAILNMRLVNMHQLTKKGDKHVVELWQPPV